MELDGQCNEAEARSERLQELVSDLQHQLQAARKQVSKLEGVAKECELIPGLRKELSYAQQKGDRLQADLSNVQVRH